MVRRKTKTTEMAKKIKKQGFAKFDSPEAKRLKEVYYKKTAEEHKLIDTISDLYYREKLSTAKIGEKLKLPGSKVNFIMDTFGIPKRSKSEISKEMMLKIPPEIRRINAREAVIKGVKIPKGKEQRYEAMKKRLITWDPDKVLRAYKRVFDSKNKRTESLILKAMYELEEEGKI